MGRVLVKALAAIVLLVLVACAGAYAYLRRSLPTIDGTITVAGVTAPVDIIRDADAVPHIFGATKRDAFFGLGYVHAQDRLWQMEFQRRIGFGRLSEIFGPTPLPQDRFLRTVGFGRAARSAWNATPASTRAEVDAYVAGINAFIATHHGSALPPEFTLLRFEPEPWSGPDVLVWVKMMAWDLAANYSFELLRHDLVRAVGVERMQQLMPPYAPDGLSILGGGMPGEAGTGASGGSGGFGGSGGSGGFGGTGGSGTSALTAFSDALAGGLPAVRDFLVGGSRTEALGSNNWVVDGTLSTTGKPLLANDPHLSTRIPSTWYLAHVVGGDTDMIGATLPGAPAVALGRNRFIAWGATNVAADVEDLYLEHVDAAGAHADYEGAAEPITVIPETIDVKGAVPVHIDVRVTRHGPIISDAVNAINAANAALKHLPAPPPLEPIAFRWTALDADDSTVTAFLKLNDAKNWTEFTGALRDFVVPSQNFVYADVDGHIGYYAPGRVPIRSNGDGARPVEGWTGQGEWTGWVPFDRLPHVLDPPDHMIVTANHRPAPADYPYNLGLEWVEPYRAQRIVDLLHEKPKFGPDDFTRIQADTMSLHARALLPVLLAHAKPGDAADRDAVAILRQWNFDAAADSAASAIFQGWFHELTPALLADDLAPLTLDAYAGRFTYVTRFAIKALTANDASWCDDRGTSKAETCDDTVTAALHAAVSDLTRRMGGNLRSWRWDRVHTAVFPHQGLDSVAILRPLLSRSVPNGGDWSTVDVGPVAADAPYEQRQAPGYREIVDLSSANDSRFLDAVGESGHFLSPYYDEFLRSWRAVQHRPMRMDRAQIERGAIGHLKLVPPRG